MSLSIHCFEELTIRRCICDPASCFPCFRKKRQRRHHTDSASKSPMIMIQDINPELCIVNAPHQHITTLGTDTPEDPWDYLVVDRDNKLVMFSGSRFRDFCVHAKTQPSDLHKGQPLADVFPKNIVDIFIPLVDVALRGLGGQLHTIYKTQGLTLFVFPMLNETSNVVGASIIYRPTKYNQMDIAKLISRKGSTMVSGPITGPVVTVVPLATATAPPPP